MAYESIAGAHFGMLTAIKPDPRFDKKVSPHQRWICRCDCGNEVSVPAKALLTSKAKDCGNHRQKSCNLTGIQADGGERKQQPQDLTGLRFGDLSVLGRDLTPEFSLGKKRKTNWLCRCDCGKEVSVSTKALLSKRARCCGEHRAGTKKELSGQKFGRLTVLEKDGSSASAAKQHRWICECDCGKKVSIPQSKLLKGEKTDCGCEKEKSLNPRAVDMTGQKFGRLTVLHPVFMQKTASKKKMAWLCRCDCGKEKIVLRNNLISGRTKSCGCLHSEILRDISKEGTVCKVFNGTQIFAITPDRNPSVNNTSGRTGVSWDKSKQRWRVAIGVQGKRINLGYFKNLEEAIDARAAGEQKYYAPIFSKY